jgi:calcineurin-like phosphoesterase family protein
MLGDISMMLSERTDRLLTRLNGRKHLVYGNHDKILRKKPELQKYFESIHELKSIDVSTQGKSYHIVMCHYPMLTWNRSHRGSIMLHGHCHGTLNHLNENVRRLDVGVDSHDYFPISLDKVIKINENKNKPEEYRDVASQEEDDT